jgi:Methyltransferase domain
MNRFWKRFIRPVIELTKPTALLEIGAAAGLNTRNLLAYCRETGAHIDIIDPAPAPQLSALLDEYDREYTYFRSKSTDAVPRIAAPDIALIDGDHNWYTVFTELTLLFTRCSQLGAQPPITFHHDVCWPYARRDMYYNPEDLDPAHRHPYAYRGIVPGRSELADEGLNDYLANAIHEGGPQNGVMTAIEDFIASAGMPITLHVLPFFHGLSILIPEQRKTPALAQLIDGFFSSESMLETCKALEEDANRLRVDLATTHIRLFKRTEALERARRLLIP